MDRFLKLIEAPTLTPLTLDELKGLMRINKGDSPEDSELTMWMAGGLEEIEKGTARKLISQTWELSCRSWVDIVKHIPYGQTQSVLSLKYVDIDGGTQTVGEQDYSLIFEGGDYAFVHFEESFLFPETMDIPQAILMQFVCGYGEPKDVPSQLKTGISLHVMRIRNDDDVEMPINDIIDQYRYHS